MPSLTAVDIVSQNCLGITSSPTLVSDISKKWNKRWQDVWPLKGTLDLEVLRAMQVLIETYRADQISGKQEKIRKEKRQREIAVLQLFLRQAQSLSQEIKEMTPQCETKPTPSDSCHLAPMLSHDKPHPKVDSADLEMDKDNDRVGTSQQMILLETLIFVGEKLDRHRETCDHLTKLVGQLSDTGAELKVTYNDTLLKLKKLGVFQGSEETCRADRHQDVEKSNQMDLGDRWRKADDRDCHSEISKGKVRVCQNPTPGVSTYPAVIQAPVTSPQWNTPMACIENNLPQLPKEKPKGFEDVHLKSLEKDENPANYVTGAYAQWKKVTGRDAENDFFDERGVRERIRQGLPGAVQDMLKEVFWLSEMSMNIYRAHIDHYVQLHRTKVADQIKEDEELGGKLQLKQLKELEEEENAESSRLGQRPVMADQQPSQPVFFPPAVYQYPLNQHAHVPSYQPFNNRKRQRMPDGNWRPSQLSFQQQRPAFVKLRSPCYNCGERTHFWRQCNKDIRVDNLCPPWRSGSRRREELISTQAVARHQMGMFYRQKDNWREVDQTGGSAVSGGAF